MSDKLSAEEQEAADKLKAESGEEKAKIDQIGDDISCVSEMLKSHVEKTEEAEENGTEEEDIDYSTINPEELAKSLVESDDPEKVNDFISRLTEGCSLMPQDMVAENGERFVSAEMMKSLEASLEGTIDEGKGFMSGIFYSMQESNERIAKVNAVNMHLMTTLTKAIQSQNKIMSDMEKSFASKPVEKKVDDAAKLPEFTEENSSKAISEATGNDLGLPAISRDVAMKAIKKSFVDSDPNEYIKQTGYCDLVARHGYEEAINHIPVDDVLIIQSNLPA